MQLSVTFRHMEPSDALKDYAHEKISRIEKYFDSVMEAHIVLSVEKFRHTADVSIISDGLKIKGQGQTGDMYSAIDTVINKMDKQAKRYREKIKRRKSGKRVKARSVRMNVIASDVEDESDKGPQIIRTMQIFAKPMDTDEAVMQLNLSQEQFLVFTDAETGAINILYRREDGNYGLIEPISE